MRGPIKKTRWRFQTNAEAATPRSSMACGTAAPPPQGKTRAMRRVKEANDEMKGARLGGPGRAFLLCSNA